MEKNYHKFLAHILSKANTLTDEQVYTIENILFPPETNSPQAMSKAAKEMTIAWEKWNKQYQEKEAARAKEPGSVKPLSETEVDELLKLEYGV
jgi:hypothetical protein